MVMSKCFIDCVADSTLQEPQISRWIAPRSRKRTHQNIANLVSVQQYVFTRTFVIKVFFLDVEVAKYFHKNEKQL